jgi:hypothetical protein
VLLLLLRWSHDNLTLAPHPEPAVNIREAIRLIDAPLPHLTLGQIIAAGREILRRFAVKCKGKAVPRTRLEASINGEFLGQPLKPLTLAGQHKIERVGVGENHQPKIKHRARIVVSNNPHAAHYAGELLGRGLLHIRMVPGSG